MVTVDRSSVRSRLAAFLVVGMFAASACSDTAGVPTPTSMVQILLTDAPSTMIASAEVWISHIYLQGGMGEPDEDGGGRVDLFNDPESPLHYDLLKLQDGLTADLTGFVEIEAGLYQGLRLVVDHAQVTLTDGLLFLDDTDTAVLKVPSGSESGIKVKLADVINAVEGESTTITVDFDVDRNFVIQGGQGPSPIRDVLFTPVLLELDRDSP